MKIVPSRKDYDAQDTEYTCQSAAISMITGGSEDAIRQALVAIGPAGDPYVMGLYLKDCVKEYKFLEKASLNDFVKAIDEGYQIITHGWFSRSGHVIKVSGYDKDAKNGFRVGIVDDPYEEFDAAMWDYHRDYRSGNNCRYSFHLLYAACVKGQSFEDARRVYRTGELNSAFGNAWLHMCKV